MICSKCQSRLYVTHTYAAGGSGYCQRLVCRCCGTVVTAATVIVATDPHYGKGAKSMARRLAETTGPQHLPPPLRGVV